MNDQYVWDESDGCGCPAPEEGKPYVVEIWQNVNGQKAVWHEVMIWNCGQWAMNSDPCKKLGSNQLAYRWVPIDSIKGWQRSRQDWHE